MEEALNLQENIDHQPQVLILQIKMYISPIKTTTTGKHFPIKNDIDLKKKRSRGNGFAELALSSQFQALIEA